MTSCEMLSINKHTTQPWYIFLWTIVLYFTKKKRAFNGHLFSILEVSEYLFAEGHVKQLRVRVSDINKENIMFKKYLIILAVLTHVGLSVQPPRVIPPKQITRQQRQRDREKQFHHLDFLPARIDCFDFLLVPLSFWCIKLEAYSAASGAQVTPWRAITGSGAGFKEESHHSTNTSLLPPSLPPSIR